MLKCCLDTFDSYPEYVVNSSIITFVGRAVDVEDQSVSSVYKRLLKTFINRYGKNVPSAFRDYVDVNIENKKLRTIFLLWALKKG